nr:hypothetical protein HK105_004456 [Polyrhizophydium stewartii]
MPPGLRPLSLPHPPALAELPGAAALWAASPVEPAPPPVAGSAAASAARAFALGASPPTDDNDGLLPFADSGLADDHPELLLERIGAADMPSQCAALLRMRCAFAAFGILFAVARALDTGTLLEYSMFLTNWCWVGMTAYFVAAAAASWIYMSPHAGRPRQALALLPSPMSPAGPRGLAAFAEATRRSQRIRRLGAAFRALYAAAHCINWIVPPVYWILLREDFSEPKFTMFRISATVVEHSVGLLFLLTDFAMNQFRPSLADVAAPTAAGVMYLVWVWVYHYAWGIEWPYFFMADFFDPAASLAMAVVGVLAAAAVLLAVHTWVLWLHAVRDRWLGRAAVPAARTPLRPPPSLSAIAAALSSLHARIVPAGAGRRRHSDSDDDRGRLLPAGSGAGAESRPSGTARGAQGRR